jgi:hypothetical protein
MARLFELLLLLFALMSVGGTIATGDSGEYKEAIAQKERGEYVAAAGSFWALIMQGFQVAEMFHLYVECYKLQGRLEWSVPSPLLVPSAPMLLPLTHIHRSAGHILTLQSSIYRGTILNQV